MCASAIRWAGFRECVYGTSAERMKAWGWPVIDLSSREVFERTGRLGSRTELGSVGADETDPYLSWQYRDEGKCPVGCEGGGSAGSCRPSDL